MLKKQNSKNEPELEFVIQRFSDPNKNEAEKLTEYFDKIGDIDDKK